MPISSPKTASTAARDGGTQESSSGKQRRRRRLCVCTRIHQNNANRPVDLVKVREFLDSALLYADSIAIAVGSPPPPPPPTTAAAANAATELATGEGQQSHAGSTLLQMISRTAGEAERESSKNTKSGSSEPAAPTAAAAVAAGEGVRVEAGVGAGANRGEGSTGGKEKEEDDGGESGGRGDDAAGAAGASAAAANAEAAAADIADIAAAAAAPVISVFEVAPWGKFTPALNALLGFAARDGAELVMFQSLETTVGQDAVSNMEAHLRVDDLVVGAVLTGHAFGGVGGGSEGGMVEVELTGITTPWNTLALWDVGKLAKLGFLGVAEGLLPGVPAGVEEVTAIAALQALLGAERARAKLVRLPQVKWQTAWEDEGRRQWHESKMSSKVERAEKQMLALGVKRGVVAHVW